MAEIARAKYELIESLPAGGTAILNADDEYVSQFGRDFHGKVVLYGMHPSADIRAENIESRGAAGSVFEVVTNGLRETASLPLVGTHNIYNALAAVAVGMERGFEPDRSQRRAGDSCSRRQTGGGRPSGQHHRHQRLLQFQSNSPGRDGGHAGRDAGEAAHRGRGRDAGTGPGGRRTAPRARAGTWRQKGIDVLIGVRGLAQQMVEAALQAGSQSRVRGHAGRSGRVAGT